MSTDTAALPVKLQTIRLIVQSWIDWSTTSRAKERLVTDGDTAIMSLPVPYWPSHSSLNAWIEALEQAERALATRTDTVKATVRELVWQDSEPGHTNGYNGRRIVEHARTSFGAYFIEHSQDDDTWWLVDGLIGPVLVGPCNEAWEIRAAAQSHFEAGILSSLEVPAHPEGVKLADRLGGLTMNSCTCPDITSKHLANCPTAIIQDCCAFLRSLSQAEPVAQEAAAFGDGKWVIDTGTVAGKPAVFVAPASMPGDVGASAERENSPRDRLICGEWYMTFPTDEQAKLVADALCNHPSQSPEQGEAK